jgi:chemotaxis protein MotB
MATNHAPTIIIVKKSGGHAAHHGGAWKVAYADFVTAMMAFFLVMWLTSQKQEVRDSIAGYFRDPGVFDYQKSKGILPGGKPGVEPKTAPKTAPANDAEALKTERKVLTDAADRIRQDLTDVKEIKTLRDQIEITVTAEGLRIELVDRTGSSFFASGSAQLLGDSERILSVIAAEVGKLKNDIVVEGHTDSHQYARSDHYGNWELSVDRSNAARRIMEQKGLHAGQVRGVRGFADTQLHVASSADPRNRRVSILVRSQAAVALQQGLALAPAVTSPAKAGVKVPDPHTVSAPHTVSEPVTAVVPTS